MLRCGTGGFSRSSASPDAAVRRPAPIFKSSQSRAVGTEAATIVRPAAVITPKVIFSSPGLPIEEQGRRGRDGAALDVFEATNGRSGGSSWTCSARPASIPPAISPGSCRPLGTCVCEPAAGLVLRRQWQSGPARRPARSAVRTDPFANTDLSGNMDHRSSIIEADRAVGSLVHQALA